MNVSARKILAGILFVISLSKNEDLCENEESEAVKSLGASLGINSFTFVQNQQNVGTLQKIRGFPGGGSFSVVINPGELEAILSNKERQKKFFGRTVLVVKEEMNFTWALQKLSGLQSVTWAVSVKSLDAIETHYIPININFFTFHCSSGSITISKVYHVRPGLRLSVESIQKWEKGGTLKINRNPNVNFQNTVLKTLFLYSKKECGNRTHVLHNIECLQQQIVKLIARKLNTRLDRIRCPERSYPYNYPNGSLADMFEILNRGEVDISSGSYIIGTNRLIYFDFAWPVFTTKSMIYMKSESIKSKWRAYLRPIENRLWNVLASWIVITGFLLQFFEESRRRHFEFRFSLILDIIKSVFLSLQVFCNQGLHNAPCWISNRIVYVLSFLLCLSMYGAYCGFLISSLTVTTPNIPFIDFRGFVRDGTYRIMTLQKGFHSYFIRTTLQEYGEEGKDLLYDEPDLPFTTKGGIAKLCEDEKLIYVEFRENIVRNEIPCKILELPNSILRQIIGLGLPKNSPYKEIFTQQINVLRSSGILHRMRTRLLSFKTLEEKETSNEQFISVSLWQVVSIFFIISAGTVLSIIIFFLEICCGFSKNRKISREKMGRRRFLKKKHSKWKNLICNSSVANQIKCVQ